MILLLVHVHMQIILKNLLLPTALNLSSQSYVIIMREKNFRRRGVA